MTKYKDGRYYRFHNSTIVFYYNKGKFYISDSYRSRKELEEEWVKHNCYYGDAKEMSASDIMVWKLTGKWDLEYEKT